MMSGTETQVEGRASDIDTLLEEMEICSNDKLPEEVLALIFQKIEDLESQLNCRLICKYWKSTFDNSRIMKQLTFVVNDWRLFSESTIVEKVKSITFTAPFLATEEERKNEWLQFCNRIGSSVEKIKFDLHYDKNLGTHKSQLINSLVSSCSGLKQLNINKQIMECLQQPKYEKIEVLVLRLLGRKDGALEFALTHFPNLVKIDVHQLRVPGATRILLEYAKASQGCLKEITVRDPVTVSQAGRGREGFNIKEQFKFLHICGNLGIKISNNFLPFYLDAKTLLAYEEDNEAPVNEVTCQSFESLDLNFDGISPLATHRIGYCRNINYLSLIFCRPALLSELQFLPKLQKLEWMHFCIGQQFLINTTVNQVNFAGQVVQFEFPTLENLNITDDVFGQAINVVLPSFCMCFANLKRICLRDLKIIPNEIIVHLSKLEFLAKIDILGFGVECQWTDDKFILPCESQLQNQGDIPVFVPAIAAFKNLAELAIYNCNNLTDLLVSQGIALSETLSEVTIVNCIRITQASQAALEGSTIKLYLLSN